MNINLTNTQYSNHIKIELKSCILDIAIEFIAKANNYTHQTLQQSIEKNLELVSYRFCIELLYYVCLVYFF